MTVNGEGDGDIVARLTTAAPARAQIDVKTSLSLRSILRHPPSAAELTRTPVEVEGNVDKQAMGFGMMGPHFNVSKLTAL